MTIEFNCGGCGKAMRAPDSSAGKRGQCPTCGNVNTIPESSVESAGAGDAAGGAATAVGGNLEFPCGNCGKVMRTPAQAAGKKGKCPACEHVFTIPAAGSGGGASGGAAASGAVRGPIEFACSNCGNTVKTPGSAAGKKGKCPRCQAIVDIPLQSTRRAPANPAGPGGLMPLDGGLTPLDGGLTPLDSPFGAAGGMAAGGFGAQNPFGDDLFGGMPSGGAAADPFGGAGGFGAAGFGGAPAGNAANPYASAPTYSSSPAYASGGSSRGSSTPSDSNRSGTPWERRQGFWKTVGGVITQPTATFQSMKRSGDTLMRVIGFAFLSSLFTGAIYFALMALHQAAFWLGGLGLPPQMMERPMEVRAVAFAVSVGVYAVTLPIGLLFGTALNLLVGTGIVHLCLMITGGARYGFEVTLRVLCYAMGANQILACIPCLQILTIVTYPLSGIVGLREAHQTTTGRAALAVFLPLIVCCLFLGGLFFFGFFAALSSAANNT
ncbi:MAG: YIP1 family protein [Planctomycetota bacterium]